MAKWSEGRKDPDSPSAKAYLFYGDGQGNFRKTEFAGGVGFHEARVADLDGDGKRDILNKPYNWDTPRVDVWLQEPPGKWRSSGRCEMKRPWLPALVLFFAAPAVGELLCGNMPPFRFFNPFSLLCLAALYGGGAILIRELALRWRKSWPTILALGAAYAAVEEGLMVKSYFNPEGPAAFLKEYGWWGGVNWPWVTDMTLYHGVHSIAVSILLVELLFPRRRGESWAKGRTLVILGALLAADVVFGFLFFGAEDRPGGAPFRPPVLPYVATAAAVALLVLIARYLPAGIRPRGPETPAAARPAWFWLIGFAGAWAFMLNMLASPQLVPPAVQVLIGAALACLIGWGLWRMSRGGAAWTDRHRLAVIAGDFCIFILFLPIVEFNQGAAKRGTTAVALAAMIFLLLLWRRVRRRDAGCRPC